MMKAAITPSKFRKNLFEKEAWAEKMVTCGVDEVGRGCLAGPLVAGAVILPINTTYRNLKDSKLLSATEREQAFRWIEKNCWFSTGIVSSQLIDRYNIWNATLIAMKKAILQLCATCPQKPVSIVIDAMPVNLFDTSYKTVPIYNFPKGEQWSSSIAAASIVAKVTRDRLMQTFDSLFPAYDFGQNKGYGTKKHKNALRLCGRCLIHRKSFLKNEISMENNERTYQQSIF